MVEEPVAPADIGTVVGLAEIVKSCELKVAVCECVSEPLVPVTENW